jgi:microcystin-dependent protein
MTQPYLGEIKLFAGNFAIAGWAFCNGQILSIAQNDILFQLIGTTYGGNGTTTFALPDLRGRVVVGQGQGASLTNRTIGESFGTENVTLSLPQLPSHTHPAVGYDIASTSPSPSGLALARPEPANPTQNGLWYLDANVGAPNVADLPADTIGFAGGNQPHYNMAPFLAVNYIISLFGVFPSRN